jgi:hypothetical protein
MNDRRLLEEVLRLKERPACEACGHGYIRAVDVSQGALQVRCSWPECSVHRAYELPSLNKTVIYLDTSIVSNIARARRPAFQHVFDALRECSYKNVIACIVSNIAVDEIELARDGERILEVARELGTTRVNHELHVRDAQIWRAFGRFRRGEPPVRETQPPRTDVFDDDVNAWPEMLSFRSHFAARQEDLDRRREHKIQSKSTLDHFYSKYSAEAASFQEIAARETDGFCRLAASEVWLTRRMEYALEEHDGVASRDAGEVVRAFFASAHAKMLPAAVINGRLHGALALKFRSEKPRPPEESDAYDIDHLSTYLPYVDVFVTDRFMASVANQGDVRLAPDYGTTVQGLGERDADRFMQSLTELTTRSQVADLSAAVYDAINAGGVLQEFVAKARLLYPPKQ